MQNLQGAIIKASRDLDSTYFEGAIIVITEHNEKGAVGFVVNNLFARKLNELEEFNSASAIDIYEGGPVDNEHLFFIHTYPELGGDPVKDGLYIGGDIHKAARRLTDGMLSSSDVKIFIGYCGWNTGELEAEIEEGICELRATASIFQ